MRIQRWSTLACVALFLVSFSNEAHARNCGQCSLQDGSTEDIVQLPDLSSIRECPPEDELFLAQAERQWKMAQPKSAPETRSIRGLELTDHPELLKMLDQSLGKKPPAAWATAKGCKNVQCVLEKIYGDKESALRVMLIQAQFGMQLQMDQSKNSSEFVFPKNELRWIHEGLGLVPNKVREQMKDLQEFIRIPKGYKVSGQENAVAFATSKGGSGTVGSITIQFEASSRADFLDTVLHEMGHHFDFRDGTRWTFQNDYAQRFGWKQIDEEVYEGGNRIIRPKWVLATPRTTVTDYAGTQPAEEFAESFSFYRLRPHVLKQATPKIYDFLRDKVFSGVEFVDSPLKQIVKDKFTKLGGERALMEFCMSEIDPVLSKKSKMIVPRSSIRVTTIQTEKKTFTRTGFSQLSVKDYLIENECFHDYARKMMQSCDLTSEFCEAGGAEMIFDWLDDRYQSQLKTELEALLKSPQ